MRIICGISLTLWHEKALIEETLWRKEDTMPFPKTRDELVAARYRFESHARCKGVHCGAEIEYWRSWPNDKRMPFNLMPEGNSPAVTHFTDCPDAEEFRSRRVK